MAIQRAHHVERDGSEYQPVLSAASATPANEPSTEPPDASKVPSIGAASQTAETVRYGSISSLLELTETLQHHHYQQRESLQLQDHLHEVHIIAARVSRLLHIAKDVQHTLAACIRAEDKDTFVNLFASFRDAISRCLEPPHRHELQVLEHCVGYPSSFMDRLPADLRHTITDFLYDLGHRLDFTAERLTALSRQELLDLLSERRQSRPPDSVFGTPSRSSVRLSRHLRFAADAQTDLLSSLTFKSPLEALVFAPLGLTNTPLSHDHWTTERWANVCAKLLINQRPGFERFIPALIGLWAQHSPWPGVGRLGLWMSAVLRDGRPLIAQSHRQSFRVRVGAPQEDDLQREDELERFLDSSVRSLLGLLADPAEPSAIPGGAIAFCHCVCGKLEEQQTHQRAFPMFVLSHWLFASFIPDVFSHPEAYGLFTDQFIPDHVSQLLFSEIASRCNKAVFEVDEKYSWSNSPGASQELSEAVRLVAQRLDMPLQNSWAGKKVDTPSQDTCMPGPSPLMRFEKFIPLSGHDLAVLVNALYPRQAATKERAPSRDGLHSAAVSFFGLSTFQAPDIQADTLTGGPDAGINGTFGEDPYHHRYNISHLSELEKQTVFRQEGERLQEARAAVEELLAGQSSTSMPQWAMITLPDYAGLTTMREHLVNASMIDGQPEMPCKGVEQKTAAQKCMTALKELLPHCYAGFLERVRRGYDETLTEDVLNSIFLNEFRYRIAYHQERSEFVSAHSWHKKLRKFQAFAERSTENMSIPDLLTAIEAESRNDSERAKAVYFRCGEPLERVSYILEWHYRFLKDSETDAIRLRDKMWYVAEVRTSATYDNGRSVSSALELMGRSKASRRLRGATPVRSWTAPKPFTSSFPWKHGTQVLELLSAPKTQCGPGKLSDDQSRILAAWLERNGIENICAGEERLQRLCMEVRKAVTNFTVDNATTWSSALFATDVAAPGQYRPSTSSSFWMNGNGRYGTLNLQTNVPPSIISVSSASSHPLSARSSSDFLDTRSPTLTNMSPSSFWSPTQTEVRSSSSTTSIGSVPTYTPFLEPVRKIQHDRTRSIETTRDQARQRVTALLLSDLSAELFLTGSETDKAFWTGIGREVTKAIFEVDHTPPQELDFDFDTAFERLWQLVETAASPDKKLQYLQEIDSLLVPYMDATNGHYPPFPPSRPSLPLSPWFAKLGPSDDHTMELTNLKIYGFRCLLLNSRFRPQTIFRDLQYIAALVPADTLNSTPRGAAFWNAVTALLDIKAELTSSMVETADHIVAYHTSKRGSARSSSAAQQVRDAETFTTPTWPEWLGDIARYDLSHAAELLQITAKEGHPVAQRELATLYLTDPGLMDHIIAPLTRPRDVFKEELESKWRRNQDPNRCDPATMCVAQHWMTLSANGGDALAEKYLRQTKEMDWIG